MVDRCHEGPGGRRSCRAPDSPHPPVVRDSARCTALAVVVWIGGGAAALAGHSISHYPSYYPDEIRIDTIDPAAAARSLGAGTLHAYVGAAPAFEGHVPDHVSAVPSLGSFLILAFNDAAPSFAAPDN